MPDDDDAFCDYVGGRLADLPGVQAVTLGGSRAAGNHRPDSDWDFAVYYRGAFTPGSIRSLGWPGEVCQIGGWGGGVFNGGAWLTSMGAPPMSTTATLTTWSITSPKPAPDASASSG